MVKKLLRGFLVRVLLLILGPMVETKGANKCELSD